jgi:murein DD-endopeptidase MepM/ murein hydrolase activator NlpD
LRIKFRIGLALLLFGTCTFAAEGVERLTLRSSLGCEIEFIARAFEPGEVVLARLIRTSGTMRAAVRFLGQEFELGGPGNGREHFAFIGLDLGVQPGDHLFEVSILGEDGRVENLKQGFRLRAREFPVKKLWVKEEYVTPPHGVQERIRWEAELLETVYGRMTPRWLGEGNFILPHDGKMALNFGERRIYNNVPRSSHSGVDISAPFGEPVRASNSGSVALARDLYFSGQTVILDHGLGLFTYYCHFSKLMVKRGDIVKKGDVVGLVGSTGRSTGPHLHWAVRILRSRVDPLALLSLWFPEPDTHDQR